jgi:hypothetical protein
LSKILNAGDTPMSIAAYLNALNSKKTELETEIMQEMKRPMPDFAKISQLKKLKLAVKTQITALLKGTEEPATA